jgi:hypothetical protein
MLCFCRLIYVLKDLIWQYEILIQNAVQILAIFHNITFFIKNYFYFCFIKILFAVFNVLFVGYSLAKNNLNNTYQYNMISKKNSKTMNYLIILIKFKVSRFLCRWVYIKVCTKAAHKQPIFSSTNVYEGFVDTNFYTIKTFHHNAAVKSQTLLFASFSYFCKNISFFFSWVDVAPLSCSANFGAPSIQAVTKIPMLILPKLIKWNIFSIWIFTKKRCKLI